MVVAGLGDSGFRKGSVVDRRSVAPNAILQLQVHVMCSLKCLCEMFKSYYRFPNLHFISKGSWRPSSNCV